MRNVQKNTTMLLCDTNIFIEIYRRNTTISAELEKIGFRNIAVSDITRGELLYGAMNKEERRMICYDLSRLIMWHINEKISASAVNLIEQYCLSHKLDIQDALIAATALYYNVELFTLNTKDFRFIPNLKLYKLNSIL